MVCPTVYTAGSAIGPFFYKTTTCTTATAAATMTTPTTHKGIRCPGASRSFPVQCRDNIWVIHSRENKNKEFRSAATQQHECSGKNGIPKRKERSNVLFQGIHDLNESIRCHFDIVGCRWWHHDQRRRSFLWWW